MNRPSQTRPKKSRRSTRSPHGFFVTFEGTEGAGKSTLMRALAELIRNDGPAQGLSPEVVTTREPGGTGVAEKIRGVILGEAMDPTCELFLYEAARAEHLAHTVVPALERGALLLCDRFTDSSLAYQAHARGLDWKQVDTLNRIATRGIRPHLTVLLDIDPATGLKRAKDGNRFEAEGVAFQTKVRQGFLKSRRLDPKRWMTIQASSGTPEELARKVWKEIQRRWRKK